MNNNIKKLIPFVLAALTIFLFSACAQNGGTDESTTNAEATRTTAAPVYKKITAAQAKAMMDGDNVVILDVRTQQEFDQGHIFKAVLLPDSEIGAKAATVLPDKNAKILVYCRTGRRSALAAKELIALGYTDVLDFGGLETDWTYITVKQ